MHGRLVSWFAFLALTAVSAQAEEPWNRFRGPNGAGQAEAPGVPARWGAEGYLWQAELPGVGHSSPVLWGDRLFVTGGDPATGNVTLLCFEATAGKEVWRQTIASKAYPTHARNSFASSTPAADAERVYLPVVTPEAFRMFAFDHQGRQAWEVTLGLHASEHGFGASPIVDGGRVVIAHDHDGESFLVALDARTGQEIWKRYRAKSDRAAYGTPCIFQAPGGKPELIFTSGAQGVTAVDPETGEVRWEIPTFDKRSVSSPVVAGGLIFGSCGSGGGGNFVVAVRPSDRNASAPEIVYRVTDQAPYVPTSVAKGNLLFLWYDKGIVSCIDAPSGKVHWQQRIGGNYSGSPIRIGERIYCVSDEGEVICLAASETYELLGRTLLPESSRATPAVAGGRLYLRTYSKLLCVGSRAVPAN